MKADFSGFKKEMIPLVLLGASAVFAVLIVVKTAGFFAESARAEGLVKRAVGQNGSDDKQIEGAIARSCAVADALKKANLFSPPEPRRHPVTAVTGILGDEVLIGSKWYKAGDRVADARIVAVEATQVRIEWDGREKIFSPLGTTVQLDSGGSRRTSRSPRPVARSVRRPPQMVTVGGGSPGGGVSAEEMKKLREKAQKQRQAIIEKEFKRASKEEAKKREPDKKKKSPEEIRRAKEKAAEKKARKLSRK
ncbi:MAG: hypothetical protein ACYSWQ_17130 [Planctomycetota bacterium]|jgi:hypothetical protein